MKISRFATCLCAGLAIPAAGHAASFTIDFSVNGSGDFTGMFTAPAGGGVVSDLSADINGVVYDTRVDGGGPIIYDPAEGDFVTGSFAYGNSVAVPGVCGILACGLELFPLPGDPEPGDYSAIDAMLNNIDDGTKYAILPPSAIPIPASAVLLLGAIGGLAALRRRRS